MPAALSATAAAIGLCSGSSSVRIECSINASFSLSAVTSRFAAILKNADKKPVRSSAKNGMRYPFEVPFEKTVIPKSVPNEANSRIAEIISVTAP